jgi:hypothetical protein
MLITMSNPLRAGLLLATLATVIVVVYRAIAGDHIGSLLIYGVCVFALTALVVWAGMTYQERHRP